jgi:hypothetical protein
MKPRPGATVIGRTALVVSVVAGVLEIVTCLALYEGLANPPGLGPIAGAAFPVLLPAAAIGVTVGIILDIVAGTRGSGNRTLGVVGGVIMVGAAPVSLLLSQLWN